MLLLAFHDFIQQVLLWAINLLPSVEFEPITLTESFALLAKPLSIFPIDMFRYILLNGFIWASVLLTWSLIEWLYKKIPGVS